MVSLVNDWRLDWNFMWAARNAEVVASCGCILTTFLAWIEREVQSAEDECICVPSDQSENVSLLSEIALVVSIYFVLILYVILVKVPFPQSKLVLCLLSLAIQRLPSQIELIGPRSPSNIRVTRGLYRSVHPSVTVYLCVFCMFLDYIERAKDTRVT